MPLRFGADPEFIFKKDGLFYKADNIYGGRLLDTKIGTDGHAQIAEFRPSPHADAISMCEEIRDLIRNVWERDAKSRGLSAHAGSAGGEGAYKPLCGHIHFNIKSKEIKEKLLPYLNVPMIMLMFLEDYDENVIRRRQRDMEGNYYGRLSDMRDQPHGFEYRTPSSWLVSPAIARGYFSIYHSLVHDFQKNKFVAKHPLTRVKKLLEEWDLDEHFRNAEHDAFRYKLKTVVNGIKELTFYKTNFMNYQNYINTMFSLLRLGKPWNEDRDMFETWGIKKEVLTKSLFFFQTKDYKVKSLIIPNLKLSNIGNVFPIRVFGLNDKKIYNISTNNNKMVKLITDFKKQYNDKELILEETNVYGNPNIELGIGKNLRNSKQDLIKELLKYIKENHKVLKEERKLGIFGL